MKLILNNFEITSYIYDILSLYIYDILSFYEGY